MEIESIAELEEFLATNTIEEILKTLRKMDPSAVVAAKRLVEYKLAVEEITRDAKEIQLSIKWGSLIVIPLSFAAYGISFYYREAVFSIIERHRWLVPLIPTYLYIALANIFDFFKNYRLVDALDLEVGTGYHEGLVEVYEEYEKKEKDHQLANIDEEEEEEEEELEEVQETEKEIEQESESTTGS